MMLRYVLRRLLAMIPLMFVVTSIAFVLGEYGAGDLAAYLVTIRGGGRMDMSDYYEIREMLKLDDPVMVRYFRWVWNALHGDLGRAWVTIGQPKVEVLLAQALPVSLQLGLASLCVVVMVGVPLGVLAAAFRNTFVDYAIVGGATVISSIPGFVLAPIAMVVLVAQLKILPSVGLGWHGIFSEKAILPVLVLGMLPIRGVVRYTRASVLEVLSQDYVRAARARGLAEWLVIVRHVLKNAMLPIITILGMTAGWLISGSIFIERIFNIRGFGHMAADAIQGGDVQASTGVLVVSALIIMTSNLLVDLSYGLLDPRVQLGK